MSDGSKNVVPGPGWQKVPPGLRKLIERWRPATKSDPNLTVALAAVALIETNGFGYYGCTGCGEERRAAAILADWFGWEGDEARDMLRGYDEAGNQRFTRFTLDPLYTVTIENEWLVNSDKRTCGKACAVRGGLFAAPYHGYGCELPQDSAWSLYLAGCKSDDTATRRAWDRALLCWGFGDGQVDKQFFSRFLFGTLNTGFTPKAARMFSMYERLLKQER